MADIDINRLEMLRAAHRRVNDQYRALAQELRQTAQELAEIRRDEELRGLLMPVEEARPALPFVPPVKPNRKEAAERLLATLDHAEKAQRQTQQQQARAQAIEARRARLQAEITRQGAEVRAWGAYMVRVESIARSKGL